MEIAKLITENGIMIIICAVFIYQYLNDKKELKARDDKYNDSLRLLSESSDNIARALTLLTEQSKRGEESMVKHDERAIKMNEKLAKTIALLEKRISEEEKS